MRQQAIKDKEKERTQFYQKQREEAKVERTKIREKVSDNFLIIFGRHFDFFLLSLLFIFLLPLKIVQEKSHFFVVFYY